MWMKTVKMHYRIKAQENISESVEKQIADLARKYPAAMYRRTFDQIYDTICIKLM